MMTNSLSRYISISDVQHTVARAFSLDPADLLSRTREQHIVNARHIAMYLCRKLAGRRGDHQGAAAVSFPRIGMAFARDHSSVIHACNAVERRRHRDGAFAYILDAIANELSADHDRGTARLSRLPTRCACLAGSINSRLPYSESGFQAAPRPRSTEAAAIAAGER